jgi:tetratricopeptide (TPR) repeat protein
MTAEERQLFETETAASEELSQLMQLWKTTDAEASLYEKYREDASSFVSMHQKLKADFIGRKNAKPPVKINTSLLKWVAIAAALTGIFFAVTLLIPSSQKDITVAEQKDSADKTDDADSAAVNNENNITKNKAAQKTRTPESPATLYAQNFTPDEIPADPNGTLDDAFFYYASKQYRKAIKAIDSAGNKALARGNNGNSALTSFYSLYYKGLSLMSLGKESQALPLFKEALALNPPGNLLPKTQWYIALCHLKENRISLAMNMLQTLKSNPNAGAFKMKAEKLLADLKE